jgi:alpha-D-ribose 1-methylphosphonate 5-triphosphate synthase subunit PhnH
MSTHLTGGFTDAPTQSARAFRTVLEALARPGQIGTLAGATPPAPLSPAAGALLLTLADQTTPVYLAPLHDTAEIRGWITFHTGAPFVTPEEAVFALGHWAELPLSRLSAGTAEYPDRAASVIVETDTLAPANARLTGPGIATQTTARLPETAFFQSNRSLFPLGLDFYFTCGDQVLGLPRTTRVEAL